MKKIKNIYFSFIIIIILIIIYNSYNTIKLNNSDFKIINKSDNNSEDQISENSFESTSTMQTYLSTNKNFHNINILDKKENNKNIIFSRGAPKMPKFRAI
ncbi:hypothetical protein [Candidatus Phytoplasma gossypii]|uniref:Effector n=1 Tax=Candidatus Phytoplasma gossypii TaxID=2982629 RepID=A0ABT9D263_9MOLU|nr:hypothetical protein ['Gossypium sp.' phytoplasma]MDO8057606.1 hypothetical protein ['Gossypium sp.' phytoplasma]